MRFSRYPSSRAASAVFLAATAATAQQHHQQQQAAAALPAFPTVAWHAPGQAGAWRGPMACRKGRVFRGGEVLEALDVRDGKRAAAAKSAGPWQDPVLDGSLVFARHQDGSVHAFAPSLDRELWQVPMKPGHFPGTACGDIFLAASGTEVVAITGGEVHWRKDLGEPVQMTPAADGKRVFVGTEAGRVVALELASGDIAWERQIGAQLGWSAPVVDAGTLFVADRGDDLRRGALNALDAATGEPRWATVFGATGFSQPSPHEGEVWAGFGTTVARFDRKTGKLDREHAIHTGSNPFGRPAVVGDAIAFGNLDGSFYVHDRASGALRWRFQVGDGTAKERGDQVGDWCLHEGVLVVGTTRGLFGLVASETPPPADRVLRANPGK
jgi:outer membrane protein assembly factor BamB